MRQIMPVDTVGNMRTRNKYVIMKNKFILPIVFAVILGTVVLIFLTKIDSKNKKIVQLESKVSQLESNIKDKDLKISDLEEQSEEYYRLATESQEKLDKVKHFDKPISSFSSSPVSYTGSAIETQIDGDFEGWDGETIFKMRNGSIWQQVSYDYTYHYAYAPDVLIYSKNGSNYMRVEGVDDEIRVQRIK